MATWNQASWDPKMQPFCKLGVLVHCLARTRKSPTIPRHVNAIALHVFVIVTVKLQQFVMNDQIFHHQSRVVTDSTSWDYPACIRDTLWRQHYVRTSKEYLINCHILLHYFVNWYFFSYNWYKFCVNWSSFEWIMKKTKRGLFYETPCNDDVMWIRCGAQANRKNEKGETPFDLAIKNGHDAIAKKFTTFMSQSTLNRMSKPRGTSPTFPDEP